MPAIPALEPCAPPLFKLSEDCLVEAGKDHKAENDEQAAEPQRQCNGQSQ